MSIRLDEIKETLKHPNITEHNGNEESFFMVSERDFKWLIEQAEQNARLRETLKFYADEANYVSKEEYQMENLPSNIEFECGEKARQALSNIK